MQWFRRMALVATGALALAWAGGAAAQAPTKLTVLVNNPFGSFNLVVGVAYETKTFARNGLDVTLLSSIQPVTPLLSGDAQVANTGVLPLLSAIGQGQNMTIIANIVPVFYQQMMAKPGSDLAKLAGRYPDAMKALKGKKIGVSVTGALVDLATRYMLLQYGIDPETDVEILALGGGAPLLSGLQSGNVDVIAYNPPSTYLAEEKGIAVTIIDMTSSNMPAPLQQAYLVSAVTSDFASKNPAAVTAYVKAIAEATEFMKNPKNHAEVMKIAAKYLNGLDDKTLTKTVDDLIALPLHTQYSCQDFEKAVTLMKSLKKLPSGTDYPCSKFVLNQ